MVFIVFCSHAVTFLILLQYYKRPKYPLTWTETMSGLHTCLVWLRCKTLWWNLLWVMIYIEMILLILQSPSNISVRQVEQHSHFTKAQQKINIIKKVTSNNLLYSIPNTFHNFNLETWQLMQCQMPQWEKVFLAASLRLLIGNWFHEHLESDEIILPIYIWNAYLKKHIGLLGSILSCQVFNLFLENHHHNLNCYAQNLIYGQRSSTAYTYIKPKIYC